MLYNHSYAILLISKITVEKSGDNMAAPFSRVRRDEIAEDLKKYAIKKLVEVEMKKISVDSLVEYAGISKGAFYKFFKSKDELFLEILEDWHTLIYGDALECITEDNGLSAKNKVAKAILQSCVTIDKYSLMKFIRDDVPPLLENIEGTDLMERYHSDDVHIKEIIKFSGIKLLVTEEEAVAIIKNLVFTVLNAEMNGYWYAQKIIINSVCDYIVK